MALSPLISINSTANIRLSNLPNIPTNKDKELYEELLDIHNAIHQIVTLMSDLTAGSIYFGIASVSSSVVFTSISYYYYTIIADATTGAITVTLPPAANWANKIIVLKKKDSTINSVIAEGYGAETIDGALNFSLLAQDESITMMSNGTDIYII